MPEEYTQLFDSNLSPQETSSRIPLEIECIQLLCRFEQLLVTLDTGEGVRRLTKGVKLARQLLNQVVSFEEDQFGNAVLLSERQWIQFFQAQLDQMEDRLQSYNWEGFADSPVELPQNLLTDYRVLGEEYTNLLSHLLSLIEPWYHSPQTAREWNASCQMFVTDFLKRW